MITWWLDSFILTLAIAPGVTFCRSQLWNEDSKMSRSPLKVWILTTSIVSALLYTQPITAQVIPDTTLPVGERSQVTGNTNAQIDGGARRGGNLFHSFSQFSVPTGGSAHFNNAAEVQNIFSRVTGGSASNIDGVIRANGTANLFLFNPHGILFGPNASLNIGGSFVASTASSIDFVDNFQYSATNPQMTPLLTVSVPVGLQMGANPGQIEVQGNGYDLSAQVPILSSIVKGDSTAGLRVLGGQTLALIGGDINIAGGTLTAEQGRIELGSARDGQVSLGDGFVLSYPEVQNFGDIRLSQQALAYASGSSSIQVQGNQVSLADGSLLLIQNQRAQAGGSIKVNAAQSLELSGISPDGRFSAGLTSQTTGLGSGADITVSTRQLAVRDGAGIATNSFSSAKTGNITVQASDSVQLIGFSFINPIFLSSIATKAFGSGVGGTVTVSTGRLVALDGGSVSSPNYGTGRGGTVVVNATEAVELMGKSLFSSPSTVTSTSLNAGDAGVVTINTARLVVQKGGSVTSSVLATGNGGSVTINATESVEVSGTVPGALPSYIGSAAPIAPTALRQAYGLPDTPNGNSGNVTINTPFLSINDGASITVSNDGTGSAGILRVNANSISLDRDSSITAATASGEGGNLDLNVQGVLLLRNSSQITASAGGNGNGGNIEINASSIVSVPTENNDIRANSVNARGGNISINASGIFGIQPRPQDTPLSDITATGAKSALSGSVQLNINQLDPTPGLIGLPTTIVDSARLIAQGCPANQGDSFIISGRGGLPPNPEQQLDDDANWQDRRRLVVTQQQTDSKREVSSSQQPEAEDTDTERHREFLDSTSNSQHSESPSPTHPSITEAIAWQVAPTGEIILIANTPNQVRQDSVDHLTLCQRS
ncbi:S-layer family protein [Trichocoleus desertorum AS-A10]|uniref:two-partner secretion domain-containing protein n=1 Tax=Trichocoleus desertorum TaxID=1481672 RepID=UPI003298C6C5